MGGRGTTTKTRTDTELILERAMVTRHYSMHWDLEYCVGCQIGPSICPFDAITHVDAVLENGRMQKKQAVDIMHAVKEVPAQGFPPEYIHQLTKVVEQRTEPEERKQDIETV